MRKLLLPILLTLLIIAGYPSRGSASPNTDLTQANQFVAAAIKSAQQGDLTVAKGQYEQFRKQWLEIEGGIKDQSKSAYRSIEDEMANIQFAFLQIPLEPVRLTSTLEALSQVNQKFISGGFPKDGGVQGTASGSVNDLLMLLDEAKQRIGAKDAAGAAEKIDQVRKSWLSVEGIVLTQSSKIYADAERDMVEAHALLISKQPDLERAMAVVSQMRDYLAPIAGKTSYGIVDAASIILREGLEALLIVVALLGFLKKAGHSEKGKWIWGGVGTGLAVSAVLAVAVKLLIGTGAFGSNNFLIAGWTGIFAAVMLIWVSYWLHSKSSIAQWNQYIKEKSTVALATGNLLSLAVLAFLAIFREGTETVLFYIGMASSITMSDLLLGIGLGFVILLIIAVAMLTIGLRVPMRPFFIVSSILVFYLGFKFTGMGIHGLQLAGLLPVTVAPYLPSFDLLALYPNWQSTIPQLLLLVAAGALLVYSQRKQRVAG